MTRTTAVLGTMTFGDGLDETASALVLKTALDSGIVDIDTANGYAGGVSEEIIGRALTGRRDDVRLASKVGMPHPDAEGAAPLSSAGITRCIDGSLRRLRTDHLDLYYLHQPDRTTSVGETLDTLGALLADGRVRAWGISNFASWQLAELVFEARARGIQSPVISQQLYNAVCRRIESEYIEAADRFGAPVIAYNPLAGGLLTGKHSFHAPPTGGRFGGERLGRMYTDRYWDPRMFDAIDRLRGVAEQAGLDMREIALRWLVDRPGVAGVLVGGSRPEQVRSNLDTLSRGPLDPDLTACIDEIGDWLNGPVPAYNR
ncbi:aryl-alcohol dehydrogenase-like predicted oxidoreductase [Microbacterium sp. SORGH_AS 1204]|uniref:aldo/keto reductase n=1 Tax=Microbacterium sp. SORGH_AS_1204 TaxID=3041785 RepID=UPI0027909CE2|nr:aldo/keto reductase [Microbacterium sp. SORGH_AS_1204]MDQ1138142.1 aryl-alcohol dehydrogenase-like predicted oxidoreductase [Microbacterium sp. SORGH_AS_1204]